METSTCSARYVALLALSGSRRNTEFSQKNEFSLLIPRLRQLTAFHSWTAAENSQRCSIWSAYYNSGRVSYLGTQLSRCLNRMGRIPFRMKKTGRDPFRQKGTESAQPPRGCPSQFLYRHLYIYIYIYIQCYNYENYNIFVIKSLLLWRYRVIFIM